MLTGSWQSTSCSLPIFGTYTIDLRRDDDACVHAFVTLKYDALSQFRPHSTKMFKLRFIHTDERIISQSELLMEQLFNFTFKFDGPVIIGHYASIFPIDCGMMKSDQTRVEWLEALKKVA